MKQNQTRYSSAVGEIWAMATFKTKYCHKIFSMKEVREACHALLIEALAYYKIQYENIGFDDDHVHIVLEMGLYDKTKIAKNLKGYTAKKLFKMFPWLKHKYFWGSGLWNPAYDMRSHDLDILKRYVAKQKYSGTGQTVLTSF